VKTIEKNTISCIKKRRKMILYTYMGKEIDDKILQEAKEKLACHIEPPKPKAPDFVDSKGKVLLTQMTTAGG
jgi:hypothetical protein